jgi:hypothetical protein
MPIAPPCRDEIAQQLRPLLGRHFWRSTRALNLQTFEFGEAVMQRLRSGQGVAAGRFGLHVQCPWRITVGDRLLVGAGDRSTPRGNPRVTPDDFEWSKPGATLCDERMEALLYRGHAGPLLVTEVVVGDGGNLRIRFDSGHTLEVFCDDTNMEQWRVFDRYADDDVPHFVYFAEPRGDDEPPPPGPPDPPSPGPASSPATSAAVVDEPRRAMLAWLTTTVEPRLRALTSSLPARFPAARIEIHDDAIGSDTPLQAHSIDVEARIADDRRHVVTLSVTVAFLTTTPRVDSNVFWTLPLGTSVEASTFAPGGRVAERWPLASADNLARVEADLPRLVDALAAALARGEPPP